MRQKGNCVQIGLHESAEGIYLAEEDWKLAVLHLDKKKICGMSWEFLNAFDYLAWNYYGIDADPASVLKLIEEWGVSEDFKFIQALVCERTGGLVRSWHHLDYSMDPKPRQPYYCVSINLSDLLNQLEDEPGSIDLLIVDVDTYEWEIFRNYDFSVKPKYICTEVNLFDTNDDIEEFSELFRKHGYTEFERIPLLQGQYQPDLGETPTNEYTLQFRLDA